ncbi:hypothetical protein KXR87_23090 [Yokenella regensburgei]|uniref:hypothetical protein n=1 Tax=Yokenella regensburgei TaxID=158877 RepID=UPI003F16E584
MRIFKTAALLMIFIIMMVAHFYLLDKIVEKHQVSGFYIFIYFFIYFLSSMFLLLAFDIFYTMKPAWALFIGGICGWFLSFCSLLITDVISGEDLTTRWRLLFMVSGVMLIGWWYFPFFIFIMKRFDSMKREL